MASAASTLSLCSSLTAQCKISHKWRTHHPLSNPNLTFLSFSSQKLSLTWATPSHRLPLPLPPKASESEAPVLEAAELQAPRPEDAKIVEASSEVQEEVASPEEPAPKREEIFAVVMVCMCFLKGFEVTQMKFLSAVYVFGLFETNFFSSLKIF